MPREQKSRRDVVNAIAATPSIAELLSTHDDHFDYELDLEVVVYGRNYNGKKVGPYVRLLSYDPGEAIINEGDWGGNTFYIVVDGSPEVYVGQGQNGGQAKVAELVPGTQFGEMSVLAGVPRNATVKAPPAATVKILEVQRPALRLLRKLPKFSEALDKTYRTHGRNSTVEDLKSVLNLSNEAIDQLKSISRFRVFTKGHVLVNERAKVDVVYLVKAGWIRRTVETKNGGEDQHDFLGRGYCFGLEGVMNSASWPYTATVMDRAEVLEVSIKQLRQLLTLRADLTKSLERYAAPPFAPSRNRSRGALDSEIKRSQEAVIETGLVDATNLLVMDMDLCVRCGNCSLACHKIHGQSRLLRRGVHVERIASLKSRAQQSLLSPQVCMHCQDPECLTGCPTGAIGRFGGGQIDIEPKACIGCGDCATQCPYDAITMIPRRGKAAAPKVGGLGHRLRDIFRISLDPLPSAVDETEDLIAVKCNLCANTPLNPEGATSKSYGCEENCPTGALARVNPRTYFEEVGEIQGLLMVDASHAVGRNIHKFDGPKRMLHLAGTLLTVLLTAAAIWGLKSYGLGGRIFSFLNMRWITGLVGLVGIAGVMTYPVRRQKYVKRAGPLRYWLLIHTYLGTIAGIMILLHGGTKSGGILTTGLMISFDLTILTGLLGIALYLIVPRMMTRIEESPLLLDDLTHRREELEMELVDLKSSGSDQLRQIIERRVVPKLMSVGTLLSQYIGRRKLADSIESAKHASSKYADQLTSASDKAKLERAVEIAVTGRRVDALIYLHRLLKVWLPPHVVFTSLMLALMIIHIIQVVIYAAR